MDIAEFSDKESVSRDTQPNFLTFRTVAPEPFFLRSLPVLISCEAGVTFLRMGENPFVPFFCTCDIGEDAKCPMMDSCKSPDVLVLWVFYLSKGFLHRCLWVIVMQEKMNEVYHARFQPFPVCPSFCDFLFGW